MMADLHDPALPQLDRALDGEAMAASFSRLLQDHRLRVRACHVERVKLRPGRNASLSYLLDLQPEGGGRTVVQRVAARLCTGGESTRRHAAAQRRPWVASVAGPALSHLPGLDMVAWWWPNDPKLIAPMVLADAARLPRLLQPVIDVIGGPRASLTGHQLHIAQYVPEHRLSLRLDLQWHAGGQPLARSVYAKTSLEPDTATAHAWLRALQASPAWRNGLLRTPAALLHLPTAELHLQAALPGRTLLEQPTDISRLGEALGGQLAALHGIELPDLPVIDTDNLHARLARAMHDLAWLLPAQAATLRALQPLLLAGLRWLTGLPMATLHGDLHARNVLVDGDQLGLIDLDSLRRGPALLELGAWLADAQARALLEGQPAATARREWQPLLDGHARACGQTPAAAALAWATAWQLLVQRAWRAAVNAKPGRLAQVPALLALALAQAGAIKPEGA